ILPAARAAASRARRSFRPSTVVRLPPSRSRAASVEASSPRRPPNRRASALSPSAIAGSHHQHHRPPLERVAVRRQPGAKHVPACLGRLSGGGDEADSPITFSFRAGEFGEFDEFIPPLFLSRARAPVSTGGVESIHETHQTHSWASGVW